MHGVGFIMHPETAKHIIHTNYISERIILVQIKEGSRTTTIVQTYAPCNDSYNEDDRKEYFDKLSDILNSVSESDDLIVMGDFNGRIGTRRSPWEEGMGPFSDKDTVCNSNGEHLLNLCSQQGLIITNSFFPTSTQSYQNLV